MFVAECGKDRSGVPVAWLRDTGFSIEPICRKQADAPDQRQIGQSLRLTGLHVLAEILLAANGEGDRNGGGRHVAAAKDECAERLAGARHRIERNRIG